MTSARTSATRDAVVLITGASSGIGREIARQLRDEARTLILVARREDRLRELADELTATRPELVVHVQPCDLADADATVAMLDRVEATVGAVDVLVNNAGFGDLSVFELAPWDKLRTMIAVNVEALTLLTHRLVGGMVARGRGAILNISSGFGLTWMPGLGVYVGTKHYVTAFTEALRLDLAGTGVVVTQVCPGPVRTEFEAVTGNPTGLSVPSLVELTPERCARIALRALRRRRALVVPGFWASLLVGLGRLTPRWILRLVYRWMGPALRRKQLALAAPAGTTDPTP